MNQSIHGVDAIQWIAGASMPEAEREAGPVEEVFAFTSKRGHDPDLIEVEDTAVAVLRFRNGALGQVLGATSMFPGALKRIQVAGRDGTAEVLEDQLTIWEFRQQNDRDESIRREFSSDGGSEGGAGDPMAIDYSLHMRNIAAFVDALDKDETFFLSGAESRKAVAIVEAIYESARTASPVSLK
jgi:predicted dehydrogenase